MRGIIAYICDGRGFDIALVGLAIVYLLVFSAYPLVYNVVISLQSVDIFNLASFNRPFVGVKNYIAVLTNPEAPLIFINTVIFVALSVLFQLFLGFGLALLFQKDFPAAGYLRGVFLAGWIIPPLVVGVIWKWIFAGDYGVLNYILMSLGVIDDKIFWLSSAAYALYAVIIANIWLGVPFFMILLSVGLAAIPKDLYDAAELDGANMWQRFRSVTLPLMRAQIGAVSALGVILTLQQFGIIAAMTKGGPSNSSNVAQYWAWQLSFEQFAISRGSAMSVMMILVVAGVAIVYTRSTRHEHTA